MEEVLACGHGKEPPWAVGVLGNRYFPSEAFSWRACRGRELWGKVSEGDQEVQHTWKINEEMHLLDWWVTDEITIALCLSDHPCALCLSSWATSAYLARDLHLFSPSDLWTKTQDILPKPHPSSVFNFVIAWLDTEKTLILIFLVHLSMWGAHGSRVSGDALLLESKSNAHSSQKVISRQQPIKYSYKWISFSLNKSREIPCGKLSQSASYWQYMCQI